MSDGRDTWLEQHHARWVTPPVVIEDAVRAASGSAIASRERIVEGEINEAWSVTTTDGQHFVARIAHREISGFLAERWAIDRCGAAGVPVPEVLYVDHLVVDDEPIGICVQRRVRGSELWRRRDEDDFEELIRRSGEILARIHSVETHGFGGIDADGKGEFEHFDDWVASWGTWADDPGITAGLSLRDIEDGRALVESHRPVLRAARPQLQHGDFLAGHVFVDDDGVTGVIDFGNVNGGNPAWDISWWDIFAGSDERQPTSLLIEGYRRVADPGDDLDVRRRLCRLTMALGLLVYFAEDGERPDAVAFVRGRYEDALGWLRANS